MGYPRRPFFDRKNATGFFDSLRSNINLFSKPNYFLLNFPLNPHIYIGVYTYINETITIYKYNIWFDMNQSLHEVEYTYKHFYDKLLILFQSLGVGSLLSMPENVLGRAVMQYGETNAYVAGNSVIVNRPKMESSQYIYQNESLVPSALDLDLAEKALAHTLLPGYFYYNRLYFQVEDKEQNFGRSTVSGKTKH